MPLDASKPALAEIGPYDVLALIAEGGMGSVYKARRRGDGLVVAIKIIPTTAARNPVLLQRFKREFNAASQLDHPNIVKAIEFCEQPPNPYLVMEFVDGESLGQRIERDGRIPEVEAVKIMAQVCQGLHRAHKQSMIHRDVKPDNVLVTADGIAKLTDLGLVKDIEGEMNLTRTGRGLGTPHFMAPEQFRNAKNADVRCDVYSLGATLYMMVTGKMPFDGCGPLDAWMKKSNNEFPAPREIDPNLSERVDWAILRAMHANPELRPASCREFVEDLTGQSTRAGQTVANPGGELWYMVYRDDEGTVHTVKGTTENIRRAYRDKLLGDASNIRACRTKAGPFQPLHGYPEFRDLVIDPIAGSHPGVAPPDVESGSRRTSSVSGSPTPPQGTSPRAKDAEAVEYGTTAQYHTPAGGLSGKWGRGSGRFPSPASERAQLRSAAKPSAGTESGGGAGVLIWAAMIVLAILLGVVSVILLK